VALLREVGASKRLATLIEAESLFNDGSAFVFFLIFLEIASGEEVTLGSAVLQLVRLSVGGPFLGLVFGFFMVEWIRYIFKDDIQETALTLCTAYLTYWVAERLEVSGVLAVVCCGLYLAKNRTAITPKTEELVHHVWGMISFISNTLLFFLTGAVVYDKVFQSSDGVRFADFGFTVALYLVMHFIRAISILMLAPCLKTTGYGLDYKTGSLLVWGALRGAIALALGLVVELDPNIAEEVRTFVVFHIAGFTVMTLIINGTTTGLVVHLLGLNRSSGASTDIYHRAIGHLTENHCALIHLLDEDDNYRGANLPWVRWLWEEEREKERG
jgi:NhaP-type Na+/H+ or K+/H+ antiporter